MRYLQGYPEELIAQAEVLIKEDKLGDFMLNKYPRSHDIRNDKALSAFVQNLKREYLKKSPPVSKVIYDNKITVEKSVLGLHTFHSRPHGRRTKASSEIRIASVFKKVPEEFLTMIVVHELAHLREKEHDRPFYKLCSHMEPNYYQYEFDLRLYLSYLEVGSPLYN